MNKGEVSYIASNGYENGQVLFYVQKTGDKEYKNWRMNDEKHEKTD